MESKPFIFLSAATVIVLFIFFTLFFFKQSISRPKLPVLGQVKDFKLLNSNGKEVTLNDLKGRVWIADFVFTTCSGICPMMTKHLAQIHRSLKMYGRGCSDFMEGSAPYR